MISELDRLHEDLTEQGAKLDIALDAPRPSPACVAATRWKLYSLARSRQEFVQGRVLPSLRALAVTSDQAKLDRFERDLEAVVTELSRHVSAWSIVRVQDDWAGYRAAASDIRNKMRQQATSDTLTLIPLLRKYASEAKSTSSA